MKIDHKIISDKELFEKSIDVVEYLVNAKISMQISKGDNWCHYGGIDKEDSNVESIKSQLSEQGLTPEDWGGDVQFCHVSAKTGLGIDDLLDSILLQSEVLELTAVVDKMANGVVVESKLDKGRGPVATVLVQEGTLNQGDIVLCGLEYGRVRAMRDENGRTIQSAGPSIPVEIIGLSGVPQSGDEATVVKDEKKAEGSDHKMEGSKKVNETTHVKGKILINGKPPSPNTLVFLETKTKMRIKEQRKGESITIHQSGLNFQPRHSIVQVGATITFSNQDKEVHNIFSKSQGNQFNLGAMPSGSFKSIEVNKAGPIVLRCNMHKDMIGTLFVVPNGYYTQPNEKGEYEFKNVKSEGYIMQVWAPMLSPDEVDANIRSADLTGVNQTFDFDIKSASVRGEIHDMTDPTDYNAIVDNIEREVYKAIEDWKNGKKFISRKRMLMAITKHFDGEGLKDAIAKSFSSKRSILLERKLDKIRKEISGYGKSEKPVTEASLKSQAEFAVAALRNNVTELQARIQPTP